MAKPGIAGGKKSPLPIIVAIVAIVVLAFVFIGLQPFAQAPGSDRDAHGCVPSEGYTWCQDKGKCLRAWEEGCPSLGNLPAKPAADASGNVLNALNSSNKPVERDSYGCLKSEGFVWCEEKQKCINPFEESCVIANSTGNITKASSNEVIVTPDKDSHGCIVLEGEEWCEEKQKCYKPFEENCSAMPAADDSSFPPLIKIPITNGSTSAANSTSPTAELPEILDISVELCNANPGQSWCKFTKMCQNSSAACTDPLANITTIPSPNGVVPVVRDAHGCIPEIGYNWCETTQVCILSATENCPS